jgi:hypothetical protein
MLVRGRDALVSTSDMHCCTFHYAISDPATLERISAGRLSEGAPESGPPSAVL